jgi:hypothetical protein
METDLTAEIEIASIKCKLKLAAIYNRVKFPSVKGLLAAIDVGSTATPKKPKRRKTN